MVFGGIMRSPKVRISRKVRKINSKSKLSKQIFRTYADFRTGKINSRLYPVSQAFPASRPFPVFPVSQAFPVFRYRR